MNREIRIYGTGHRPNKFQKGYSYETKESKIIKQLIKNTLEEIIKTEKETNKVDKVVIISGGALGFDDLLFIEGLEIKEKYKDKLEVEIVLAVPHRGWYKARPTRYWKECEEFYSKADTIKFIDEIDDYAVKGVPTGIYEPNKNKMRNRWMVDNGDICLALWDGSYGGTYSCLYYAVGKTERIINLWNEFKQKLKK